MYVDKMDFTPLIKEIHLGGGTPTSVSYTHLRAHETVLDLVCRLLLENKNYCIYPLLPLHYLRSTILYDLFELYYIQRLYHQLHVYVN